MTTALRFDELLRILCRHEVEFLVVGGVAAILQGSPLTTEDLDVVYSSSEGNTARLAAALAELEATYVDPAGRRIVPDAAKLASLRVHLLKTTCGRLDLLRFVGNGWAYADLVDRCRVLRVDELAVRVLEIDAIIATKEHANRPKDRYQLPFLRQLLVEIRRLESR